LSALVESKKKNPKDSGKATDDDGPEDKFGSDKKEDKKKKKIPPMELLEPRIVEIEIQ